MEIAEELSAGSNDVSVILKGKRTKRRQRPLSPIGGCRASSSSSGGGGGEDGEVVGYITTSMSTDISATSTTTHQEEDDQDIANCLMLLAQGERGRKQVKTIDHHEEQDQNHQNMKMQKFISKKFNETGDQAGIFVYECKTCNRTFSSFQALGGHRASHKKPKTTADDKKTAAAAATVVPPPPPPPPPPTGVEVSVPKDEHGGQLEQSGKFLEIKANGTNHKVKNHHHECSICGAEFASGQALGGHMRRHRNPPPPMPPHPAVMSTQVSMVNVVDEAEKKNPRKTIFTLDLNLPAPVEEEIHDYMDLQFQQQQHHLVFSSPALVGCHY